MNWIKYLPALLKFKDAVSLYKSENKGEHPKILHRRVMGAFILAIGTAVAIYTGQDFDQNFWNSITDNIVTAGSAVVALYGAVMHIVGWLKRKR